jgi:hypothetical protein
MSSVAFFAMLQKVDGARLAAIGRARHVWDVRTRLGYPDAPKRVKSLQAAEQRCLDGEPAPVKPRVVAIASPVTKERIECYQARTRAPWRWWR